MSDSTNSPQEGHDIEQIENKEQYEEFVEYLVDRRKSMMNADAPEKPDLFVKVTRATDEGIISDKCQMWSDCSLDDADERFDDLETLLDKQTVAEVVIVCDAMSRPVYTDPKEIPESDLLKNLSQSQEFLYDAAYAAQEADRQADCIDLTGWDGPVENLIETQNRVISEMVDIVSEYGMSKEDLEDTDLI